MLDNGPQSLGQYLLLIYGGLHNKDISIALKLNELNEDKHNWSYLLTNLMIGRASQSRY